MHHKLPNKSLGLRFLVIIFDFENNVLYRFFFLCVEVLLPRVLFAPLKAYLNRQAFRLFVFVMAIRIAYRRNLIGLANFSFGGIFINENCSLGTQCLSVEGGPS